ncbi:unnamed protein product [Brassica rapa]|uniref:Uncharacterized protein n=2 Tax=Brassica TaxID=3705 RepID=A0A8D9M5H6_BRACM|nr:unnamed protein product [Brassica napus]CAG7897745.1 unnamed protein product [Brassica rapa]
MFGFVCECFYLSRDISEFDLESSEPKPFWFPSPLPCWPHGIVMLECKKLMNLATPSTVIYSSRLSEEWVH